MTNEIKKLIDELPKYDPHQIAKYSHERAMNGLKSKLFVGEDNVIALFEKSTKWIDKNDETPITFETGSWDGKRSEIIIVKCRNGEIRSARFYEGTLDGFEFKEFYDSIYDFGLEVTEWKPI